MVARGSESTKEHLHIFLTVFIHDQITIEGIGGALEGSTFKKLESALCAKFVGSDLLVLCCKTSTAVNTVKLIGSIHIIMTSAYPTPLPPANADLTSFKGKLPLRKC